MKRIFIIVLLLITSMSCPYALSLKQAEIIALNRADELRQYENMSSALDAQAIASAQFADPTLLVGALNFPVDTFKLSQEPMTQIQAGIGQVFPKGNSLKFRFLNLHEKANAQRQQKNLQKLTIIKNVRILWYQLYLWTASEKILISQRKTFKHLKEVAGYLFSNNKVPQKDVLNAQLELSQIDERLIAVRQAAENTQAQLARWIGDDAPRRISQISDASLKKPASSKYLKKNLINHPFMTIDKAEIAAAKANVNLAKEDYKPGFSAGVAYGYRQGVNIDGRKRPDFLTGIVNVSMPIFPKNRQDKKLISSEQLVSSAIEKYHMDYKVLSRQLSMSLIDFQKLKQRVRLYQTTLISEAHQYADSTLLAYQNFKSDFINVAQSHIRLLDLQLAELKEQVSLKQIQANLLYFQGLSYEK